SETIPSDVKINGLVSLKGQAVISSDDGYVRVGDLTGGDGKRSLMLRSGDLDSVVVSQSGDVGVGINNPNSKLDVAGNVNVRGKLLVANSIPIYQCPIFLSEGNCAPSTCTGALSTSSTCSWKSQAGTQCYTTTPACTFAGYLVPQ
ncbi:MAG: hypothetical protein Q7S27_01715, partial [Nanoarchaeota archaeon]|nr:hypothetical protein [Nanoarchaeota archaeon]